MKIYKIIPALFLCLLLTACNAKSTIKDRSLAADKYKTARAEWVIARLLDFYSEWKGVPHYTGGTSKDGVDCCGFAYLTFREKFDIRLPRSTSQLARRGKPISKTLLQPGDLVFFKIRMGDRHVGIYVEDQKFIHASKSEGVMLSRLDHPYWQENYWQARRMAAL